MSSLFNPSFWFAYQPPAMMTVFLYVFSALFTATVVISIVLMQRGAVLKSISDQKHLHSWYIRFSKQTIFLSIFGFVWLFFSWQRIAFLGSRFWILVWGIYFLAILWRFLHEKYVVLPQKRAHWEKTQKFKQYLPNKKS